MQNRLFWVFKHVIMLIPHQKHPQSGILLHSCISEYSSSTLLSGHQPLPFPENDRVHNFIRVKLGDRPFQEEFVVRTAPRQTQKHTHSLCAAGCDKPNSFTLADAETTWSLVHLICTAFFCPRKCLLRGENVSVAVRDVGVCSAFLKKSRLVRNGWSLFLGERDKPASSISQVTVW